MVERKFSRLSIFRTKKKWFQLVKYVDNEVSRYFDVKAVAERSRSNVWSNYVLDYLDTRHYWEKEYPLKGDGKKMKDLVISKAKTAK